MINTNMENLINGVCDCSGTDELYVNYHDKEWGKPVHMIELCLSFLC